MTFKNPINVCVTCVPVITPSNGIEYLIIQRNIEPFINGFAFPGGYQNEGDSMRVAAARELKEEVGIDVCPFHLNFVDEKLNINNRNLSFWVTSAIKYYDLFDAAGNYKLPIQTEEVAKVTITDESTKLCFPFHQEVLEQLRTAHY
jgi:ADP-ribose pyrophosphatase YjhB (NUDIX family)